AAGRDRRGEPQDRGAGPRSGEAAGGSERLHRHRGAPGGYRNIAREARKSDMLFQMNARDWMTPRRMTAALALDAFAAACGEVTIPVGSSESASGTGGV